MASVIRSRALATGRQAATTTGRVAIQRRAASTLENAASKVKDAAAQVTPSHAKGSSDVPWALGSLAIFGPLAVYLSSPPSKKSDQHTLPAPKEKFKSKLRIPEPGTEHYKIPEGKENIAGEGVPHKDGDHGLRAKVEEHAEEAPEQRQGNDINTSSDNNAPEAGMKPAGPEKFQAATKMAVQANQQGGGAAAQNTKAVTQAAQEARSEVRGDKNIGVGHSAAEADGSFGSSEAPANSGQKIAEKLTEGEENNIKKEGSAKDADA